MSDNPEPAEDLEDLYETAPCGFASLSPQGRIVKVNRTLADWLGRAPLDLIGRPFHDVLGFGGKIAFETHLAPLLRMQGHVYEIAIDLVDQDGNKVPAIVNAAEKRGPDGQHLFTRITLFKAVDRRTYERSLLEARLKAEAESKSARETALLRDQFIAVLGHDLRNPLAAVAAGIGMLDKYVPADERPRRILKEMQSSVERATKLIDDVLDLARNRLGGGLSVNPDTEAPLTPVLEQVVAEIRSIAPDRRIDVRIAIDEPLCCDRDRIAQLTSNLLANAETHGAPDRPIRFEAYTDGDLFTLFVANAGEPIPENVRAKLFEPFFRGEPRSSRNGLGLGLFIASQIAKAHDGSLEARSTDEETRFTFTMPVRKSVEVA